MATAAVVGLSSGKVLLRSSFYSYDLPTDKPFSTPDQGFPQYNAPSNRTVIVAKRSSNFGSAGSSSKHKQSIKAIKEHVETSSATTRSIPWLQRFQILEREEVDYEQESSLEALLLLQKSMLEKQWTLPFEHTINWDEPKKDIKEMEVTRSGTSARTRRTNTRKKVPNETGMETTNMKGRKQGSLVGSELLQRRVRGYAKGVMNENLLTHAEVVHLSKKIRAGLSLEEQQSRLKKRLGYEPSDEQLASSLKISCAELHSKRIECSLAREKLTMSNIRLVIFIAQRYDNMGVQMSDLIQGGLIGLLRGIEKFDSSKGFKFSTYVYWWIRQGVTRSLVENSRMLRLPTHLHERLSLIRNAKIRLEVKGVVPTIDRIAENLNMSEKKVRNATEATSKVFSLDRDAFPSLNGLPGETLHSYIADTNIENIPWDGVHECSLKDEVNKLLNVTLSEREREIVRLYYGLDKESCTWEDISKQIGLSRERVRQVGLVAMEKLKHVARRRQLEVMLVKH